MGQYNIVPDYRKLTHHPRKQHQDEVFLRVKGKDSPGVAHALQASRSGGRQEPLNSSGAPSFEA